MEITRRVKQMDIKVETVRPYFESFFTKISAEQWELLKSCKPDEATTFMLADLLLKLMTTVSNAIAKRCPDAPLSEEEVRSILGDTLNDSLSPGTTKSKSLDKLTDLVVEEVTKTVNSTLSASSTCVSSEKPIPTRLINPAKVQKMICYACETLKADAKIQLLLECQSRRRSRAISSEEQDASDDPIRMCRTSSSSHSSGVCSKSGSSSEGGSTTSSIDSGKMLVQETINNSLTDITDFFDEFNDSLFLNSSFSPEIDMALDEIIESINKESKNGKESPQPNLSISKGMRTINSLFIKTFATAGTLQILTGVAKKFKEETKVNRRLTIQSLMASVDAVLLEKEKPGGGNESSAFQTLKKPPSEKVLVFTKQLSDLIYAHIAPGRNSDISSGPVKKVAVPDAHRGIYADIQTRVFCFLSLISWWLNNQVNCHTKRVSEAFMAIDSLETNKQSSSSEVSSIEEKTSKQSTSSEVSSGGNERPKKSTPPVFSGIEEKGSKQTSSSEVSSSENKRSKQSTPAVFNGIEEKGTKQTSSSEVSRGGKKRPKQSTSSEVSRGGKKRSKQSTSSVVSSIEEKRPKQSTSSEFSSIEEKTSKQTTSSVVSSSGNKRSKQTTSSEVSKEKENSASSDSNSREKIAKMLAADRCKMYVSVLLDQLITRSYNKAKVTRTDVNITDTSHHLLERIWAEVKDIDSTFNPNTILDEVIFKELCKKWPCPEMLLVSFLLRDPELEISISSSLKRRLCKKPGFFSSFRAGFSSFFRR